METEAVAKLGEVELELLENLQQPKPSAKVLMLEHVSPATRLLEKRRQAFQVQEALEIKKHEYDIREQDFHAREVKLKQDDTTLQQSLITFSKFLQDNDRKRVQAEKRLADEVKLRLQKEREIEQLSEVLDGIKADKERMADSLAKHVRYRNYLESVLDAGDDYQETPELLARHATLLATNADLREALQTTMADTAVTQTELQAYHQSKMNEVLMLSNRLALLKQQLEEQQQDAGLQEARKDYSLQVVSQKKLHYGQVVMSTDNLYNRCRSKSRLVHAPTPCPLDQLDIIANYVGDLAAIIKQYHDDQNGRKAAHGHEP